MDEGTIESELLHREYPTKGRCRRRLDKESEEDERGSGPLRPLHLGSRVNALKGARAPGGRGEQRILAAVELSLNEAADLAGVNAREMIDILLAHGVRGNVRLDQQRKALDFAASQPT